MSKKRSSATKIAREKARYERRLAKKRRKPLPDQVERVKGQATAPKPSPEALS